MPETPASVTEPTAYAVRPLPQRRRRGLDDLIFRIAAADGVLSICVGATRPDGEGIVLAVLGCVLLAVAAASPPADTTRAKIWGALRGLTSRHRLGR